MPCALRAWVQEAAHLPQFSQCNSQYFAPKNVVVVLKVLKIIVKQGKLRISPTVTHNRVEMSGPRSRRDKKKESRCCQGDRFSVYSAATLRKNETSEHWRRVQSARHLQQTHTKHKIWLGCPPPPPPLLKDNPFFVRLSYRQLSPPLLPAPVTKGPSCRCRTSPVCATGTRPASA